MEKLIAIVNLACFVLSTLMMLAAVWVASQGRYAEAAYYMAFAAVLKVGEVRQ